MKENHSTKSIYKKYFVLGISIVLIICLIGSVIYPNGKLYNLALSLLWVGNIISVVGIAYTLAYLCKIRLETTSNEQIQGRLSLEGNQPVKFKICVLVVSIIAILSACSGMVVTSIVYVITRLIFLDLIHKASMEIESKGGQPNADKTNDI